MRPFPAIFCILSICVVRILFPSPLYAQNDWLWQNPVPQGNTLYDVTLTEGGRGWSVGEYGTILFTLDEGVTWTRQQSGTVETLRSVHAFSPERIFVTGADGSVLKTHDAGETWTKTPMDGTAAINRAFWISETTGWVVGNDGLLRSTDDGGANWTDRSSGTTEHLNDVAFGTETIGVAVGNNSTMLRTSDGGITWEPGVIEQDLQKDGVHPAEATNTADYFRVQVVAGKVEWELPGTGVYVGIGTGTGVTVSFDDGNTWREESFGFDVPFQAIAYDPYEESSGEVPEIALFFSGVNCAGKMFIELAGTGLRVEWGDPDGNDWNGMATSLAKLPTFRIDHNMSSIHENHGRVVRVGDYGAIGVSDDAGETWTNISQGATDHLYAIHANDHGVWAAGQRGIILFSPDGEPPWEEQPLNALSHSMNALTFVDANNGWAAGNIGRIYRTSNGGESWDLQESGVSQTLYSIFFVNVSDGWAVGREGTILSTTDGGGEWTLRQSGIAGTLYSVAFSDSQTGWIVGDDGVILGSTDGGINWSPQTSDASGALRSVTAIDASSAVAVGIGGVIVKTTDGGEVWEMQESGLDTYLRSVHFYDAAAGWASGFGGVVLRTTNGGENWSALSTPTNRTLNAVWFKSPDEGYVGGDNGMILNTTTGGGGTYVTGIDTEADIASHFTLFQNYPNPFNPATTIRWHTTTGGYVQLSVFDMLGREVAELVSGWMSAGFHEVIFDASSLSSGSYFYRLTLSDGEFTDIKKLVFIK